ncbi:MAG: protein kinase domain-containing protein [Candidatus Xenobia bacterium]
MPIPGGTEIGRYRFERLLAQGGFGEVYLGTHLRLNRRVAIKVLQTLSPDPAEQRQFQEQFEREAKILASLDHPNLAKVTDFFDDAGTAFLVMEFIEGEDLASRAAPERAETIVLGWALQIVDALVYLHSRNPPIIMRDLNPRNIMLTGDGHIKLVDFGIARPLVKGQGTRTEIRGYGTAGYAPPEQYGEGGTDERSDLYSLGATLVYLLTNQSPPEAIARVTKRTALLALPGVTPHLSKLIESLMALSPDDRPSCAEDVRSAINLIAENRGARDVSAKRADATPSAGSPQVSAFRRTVPVRNASAPDQAQTGTEAFKCPHCGSVDGVDKTPGLCQNCKRLTAIHYPPVLRSQIPAQVYLPVIVFSVILFFVGLPLILGIGSAAEGRVDLSKVVTSAPSPVASLVCYRVIVSGLDALGQAGKVKEELERIDGVMVTVQDQTKTDWVPNGKYWVGIEADDGLASEFADNVKSF